MPAVSGVADRLCYPTDWVPIVVPNTIMDLVRVFFGLRDGAVKSPIDTYLVRSQMFVFITVCCCTMRALDARNGHLTYHVSSSGMTLYSHPVYSMNRRVTSRSASSF